MSDQDPHTNNPRSRNTIYHTNQPYRLQRMGILIHHPPTNMLTNIRWSHAIVGMFFDHSPPSTSYVHNIINNHWTTRAHIRVYRTGPYYVFECEDLRDREAMLTLNTTFIDGKVITFCPSSETQIPASVNFNMARIWVRIHDLPWGYLNTEWTVRISNHVGLVDVIDSEGRGMPQQPFLRARLVLDITKPLIPGCFLPLDEERVAWVYFRYEGIFKFCKECGCVGHNTGRCPLSAYDARRIISSRLQDLEHHGMTVLQT